MRNLHSQLTLQDALVEELQALLCLEKSFMLALPMMTQNVKDPELQGEFERLYDQSRQQIERLSRLISPADNNRVPCPIESAWEVADTSPAVRDALLLAMARKIQHQKIASYTTVHTWASALKLSQVEQSLARNLKENEENCETLRRLALQTCNYV